MYTVKQLSDLADVSVRTLHYYDEIGLLKPSKVGENGYRYYDDASLLRLQQVLFYREIGLELMQIKDILDSPDFDLLTALRSHRTVIQGQMKRMQKLIGTIDSTIMHLAGETEMSKKKNLFKGFSEKKQKQYEREARLQWGPENVNESVRRWDSYSDKQKQSIQEEGGEIYLALAKAMKHDLPATDSEVQGLVAKWHQHIRYFYEPTLEILRGLGEMYNTQPEFIAFYEKIRPGLAGYLQTVITRYADDLETAEIEALLAGESVEESS